MMAMDEDELDLDSVKKSLSQLNKADTANGMEQQVVRISGRS